MPTTTPLSEAQRADVSTGLNTVRTTLSCLVGLHPTAKQRMMKMGSKSRAFVEDAIKIGISNPGMLPRSIDPVALQGKLTLHEQLREVQTEMRQFSELLNDTVTVLGSELYDDARLIYALTKTKAQADGLNATAAELAKRFAGQGRRSADKTVTTAPMMQ